MIRIPHEFRKAFYASLGLHLGLFSLLGLETSSTQAVLTAENKNSPGSMQQPVRLPQKEIIQAVSVDNKQLMQTVNRLKQEQQQRQQAQINQQKELARQVALAKQERLKEQQRIAQLKEEASKIAILRKKQALEEKKRLKELAEQKALEAKRLQEIQEKKDQLVKQQQLEEEKLAQLHQKKAQEKAKAEKVTFEAAKQQHLLQEQAAREKLEKQKQAALAQQALEDAENQARIAGEVNKYKALILNAIGRHWIAPENVDRSLSSQFRIRLAPDGTVLEVSLTHSSGDRLLDRSAQTAIYKASPLPVPADQETFNVFRDIRLTVRPEHIRG
jgi:colicin import membrane protein